MSDDLPAAMAALVERIAAPEPVVVDPDPCVTGALSDLRTWWLARTAGALAVGYISVAGADDVESSFAAGVAAADAAIDSGSTLVVPRVVERDDHAARSIIVLLTRRDPSACLPQPAGMADAEWMRRCAAVRDAVASAAPWRGSPVTLLDHLGAPSIAAAAGVLLAASARRTPCLVDGTDELAAALVADRLCYRAKGWWRAASDSPDPGRAAAVDRIDLDPGLPLALTDECGQGAASTIALLTLLTDATPGSGQALETGL